MNTSNLFHPTFLVPSVFEFPESLGREGNKGDRWRWQIMTTMVSGNLRRFTTASSRFTSQIVDRYQPCARSARDHISLGINTYLQPTRLESRPTVSLNHNHRPACVCVFLWKSHSLHLGSLDAFTIISHESCSHPSCHFSSVREVGLSSTTPSRFTKCLPVSTFLLQLLYRFITFLS